MLPRTPSLRSPAARITVGLLLVALANACTDNITTAPVARAIRPSLDVSAAAAPDPVSFCNPAAITIPRLNLQPFAGPGDPFPSTVSVSGIGSGRFKVTATVRGLNHTLPHDIDMLLVGPTGVTVMLLSDVINVRDFINATLTFDDDATSFVPSGASTGVPNGTYKPTNLDVVVDPIPGGSPAGPYGSSFAGFAGTNPNGTWRLYVWDDLTFGNGSMTGGWCVTITLLNTAPIANAGGPYTGNEGSPITFDGTGSTDPDDEPIASYAWTFGDGETGSGPTPQHVYGDNGTYSVTLVVTDDDGASSEATTTVTVHNIAPTATLNAPASVNEGMAMELALTDATDASAVDQAAGFTYAFDCGTGYGEFRAASTASCPTTDDDARTVKAKIRDKDLGETEYTASVAVTNVAPVVTALGLPPDPVAVGTPVSLSASFTDVGTVDTHTASFDLDNSSTVAGTVAESNGSGTATAVVTYSEAGVYVIRATVTDDDGAGGQRSSALDVPSYIVVYDPTAGFVTGGGWIWSPGGAYVPDPALTGKASFGFVAKYQKGASTPSGNTEFQFKAGGLNFKSTSYEWLVVAGSKAKYKGEGTINGAGAYGFMLTAIDGDVNGGGSDAFRIKIWDLGTGSVVYDNKLGEDDTSDAATALGGGSIVIHDK